MVCAGLAIHVEDWKNARATLQASGNEEISTRAD